MKNRKSKETTRRIRGINKRGGRTILVSPAPADVVQELQDVTTTCDAVIQEVNIDQPVVTDEVPVVPVESGSDTQVDPVVSVDEAPAAPVEVVAEVQVEQVEPQETPAAPVEESAVGFFGRILNSIGGVMNRVWKWITSSDDCVIGSTSNLGLAVMVISTAALIASAWFGLVSSPYAVSALVATLLFVNRYSVADVFSTVKTKLGMFVAEGVTLAMAGFLILAVGIPAATGTGLAILTGLLIAVVLDFVWSVIAETPCAYLPCEMDGPGEGEAEQAAS